MSKLTRLGEIFNIDEEYEDIVHAVISKSSELGLDILLFESDDFAVSGGAILERHVNYSPDCIPERLRYYNIMNRHKEMTVQQAKVYRELMLRAEFTYRDAISAIDDMIKSEGISESFSWLERVALSMEECDVCEDDVTYRPKEPAPPPIYGFHKVDNMYAGESEVLWFNKQPAIVKRMITTPRRCKTIEQLKKLGRKCYEAETEENKTDYQTAYLSMTNVQRTAFWDEYNQKKRELMNVRELSDTAKGLISVIKDSYESSISKTKAKLVKIQKGQIKIREPPNMKEWNIIWNHYKQREYEVNHPLPEVPEGKSRCGYCQQNGGIMYMPKIDLITGHLPIYNDRWLKRLHCWDCTEFYSC